MRSKGKTFLHAKLSAVLQPWERKSGCLASTVVLGLLGRRSTWIYSNLLPNYLMICQILCFLCEGAP